MQSKFDKNIGTSKTIELCSLKDIESINIIITQPSNTKFYEKNYWF
jgi:hypothetical protein